MRTHDFFRVAILAVVAVFILTAIPQTVNAQVSKKNEKQEEKQGNKNFKEKVKELEKEGWKITGDYRTLELALIEHQNKIDESPQKYGSATGETGKCRSIDACKQTVQFQAQRQIAEELSADIEGIRTQISNLDLLSGDELNKLINAFTSYTKADVSGMLTPSYSLIKENGDDTKSFRTIYIVDLSKKIALRETALEKSLKETKLTIEEASTIQKFVKETIDAKQSTE